MQTNKANQAMYSTAFTPGLCPVTIPAVAGSRARSKRLPVIADVQKKNEERTPSVGFDWSALAAWARDSTTCDAKRFIGRSFTTGCFGIHKHCRENHHREEPTDALRSELFVLDWRVVCHSFELIRSLQSKILIRTMRSTEHLPAGTPSAWSLRSRHSARQRSGAGDRGRSAKK